MGRNRTKDLDLPPRMYRRGACFYYVSNTLPRKWIALGDDLEVARVRWAKLEAGLPIIDVEPPPAPPEPYIVPPLDRNAVFQPIAEIRARRIPYSVGRGPEGSGIYFLFLRWALVYVGKSVDMAARLRAHYLNIITRQTSVIPFDKVAAIEVNERWLLEVESYYIAKYRPPFNVMGVWSRAAPSLRSRLR